MRRKKIEDRVIIKPKEEAKIPPLLLMHKGGSRME
jgi:hypothetical protein